LLKRAQNESAFLSEEEEEEEEEDTRATTRTVVVLVALLYALSLSKTLKKARWWCQNVEMISVPLLHFFCFGDDGF
jgi:hypothetical protein